MDIFVFYSSYVSHDPLPGFMTLSLPASAAENTSLLPSDDAGYLANPHLSAVRPTPPIPSRRDFQGTSIASVRGSRAEEGPCLIPTAPCRASIGAWSISGRHQSKLPSRFAQIARVRIRDLNLLLGQMPRGVTVGFLPFGVTDIRLGSTFDADTGCAHPAV